MTQRDEGDRPGLGARLRRVFGLDRGKPQTAMEPAHDTPTVPPPPALRDGAAILDAVVGRVHVLVAEARGDPAFARWRRPYVLQSEPVLTRAALKDLDRAEKAELLRELLRRREAAREPRDEAPDVMAIMPSLLQQMAPLSVEEATIAMRFLARGTKHLWGLRAPIAGLQPLLAGMERGEAGRFAAHAPLLDAYRAMRERFPTLHPNAVRAQEMAVCFSRILGLPEPDATDPKPGAFVPPTGMTPPGGRRLPTLATPADALRVQEFGEIYEALGAELRAWFDAHAANPRWMPRAESMPWLWEAARQHEEARTGRPVATLPPLRGTDYQTRKQIGDGLVALLARTPLAWFATLDPPIPPWVLEAKLIHADAERAGRAGAIGNPGLTTLSLPPSADRVADDPPAVRGPYTAANLRTWRTIAERLLDTPGTDWAVEGVQGMERLLSADGDLLMLLWKARSAAPGKGWLQSATGLHRNSQHRASVEGWVDLVADGSGSAADRRDFPRALWYHTFEARVLPLLEACGSPREAAIIARCTRVRFTGSGWTEPPARLSEANDIVLRGAVWFLGQDAAQVPRLLRLALALLDKVPTHLGGVTYRSLVGINACIGALGRIATPEAVGALGRIQRRVRDQGLIKTIAKAMATAATQAGMPIEDLEEISVPAFDLSGGPDPVVEVALAGGATATLAIASSTAVPITLRTADGRVPKSVPAAVKQDKDSTEALKTLRATAKEVADVLGVQRLRLERSWLTGRSWTGRDFQERILDHPLLGWFAARLVWTVTPAAGGAARSFALPTLDAAAPLAADDTRLPPIGPEDVVALWHPLGGEGAAAVEAWRGFLDGTASSSRSARPGARPIR